ncbi:MAG: hypothetical protein HY876_11055 [Coriobacteriales bacterium]|nr:hypothetical protein [Coriobacteriales bacterium]
MRFTRRLATLTALVAIGALVFGTATAFALTPEPMLENSYGQKFAGQEVCVQCHATAYDETTHSNFARTAVEPTEEDMWPAGRIGAGESIVETEVAFVLGWNTGLREYLKWRPDYYDNAAGPIRMLEGMEWDPALPDTWELALAGIEEADYGCSQCHHLGVQKNGYAPTQGHGAGSEAATQTSWAMVAGADKAELDTWVPGASIQCERCHGTGLEAAADEGGHWLTQTKIVGGWASDRYGMAASKRILDSGVCGQCHGTYKSGSNIVGYTPDTTLTAFVTPYSVAESYETPTRFFPNGINKGMKHSYYSEWTVSGHALRAREGTSGAFATEYNKTGASHFNPSTSILCNRCHTGEGYLKRKDVEIMSDWVESTANAGYFGQECAVCHVSHGAQTDSGMGVREPDVAGEGSCTGLSTDNASICEDCHNWQNEITGGTPVITTNPTTRVVSHPQREMLHGRQLFEVAEGEEFMPGAKCEECHMPASRSDFPDQTQLPRYANQSWKRYSHRMFIMEPADAESYGLAPWGDSCSPCHAGETQAELQANIDGWQDEATALLDDAEAALTAARLRTEAGTAAGTLLIGRGNFNVKAVQQDGSGGAHNPPYEQAGLEAAIRLADSVGGDFDIVAPGTIFVNNRAAIAANIMNGDASDAAGAAVALERSTGGGWVQDGATTADENGNVAFIVAPAADTTYRLRWDRSSSNTSDLYSDTFTIEVDKFASATTSTITKTSMPLGATCQLKGTVTPFGLPSTVTIQYKKGSGNWYTLGTVNVSGTGTYAKSCKPGSKGTWYYRARYNGTATIDTSFSPARRVVVY